MPYRRLPNTDQARLRALKAACEATEKHSAGELLFGPKIALDVKSFTPIFEQEINRYNDLRTLQANIGKNVSEIGKTARMYLSHYIQVLNMCIMRGEIKKEAREAVGLEECGSSLPDLSNDQALLDWGKAIVAGEERRSGNRIYNPSIAVVKVKMSQFEEQYNKHRDILQTIQKQHSKLDEIREKANHLILDLWNEIEASLAPIDSEEKRQKCTEYGIVYFYRPHEKQKDFLMGICTPE